MFVKSLRHLAVTGMLAIALAGCAPRSGSETVPTAIATSALPTHTALAVLTATPTQAVITATPVQVAQRSISFEPREGGVNTQVVVRGEGAVPDGHVVVRLGMPDPVGEALTGTTVDMQGHWESAFVMPDSLPSGKPLAEGQLFFVAMDADTNEVLASAPFIFHATASGSDEEITARLPDAAETQSIGTASIERLIQDQPETNVVAGAATVAGEYAVALAQPFGGEMSYVFLKGVADSWQVILVTTNPGPDQLRDLGVPASLMADGSALGVINTMIERLNDPRGQGVSGKLSLEKLADGYAKVIFTPEESMQMDSSISYLRDDDGTWTWLTGGTAFMPEDLDALGIPASVR